MVSEHLEIIIWDYNPDRIAAIEHNLHCAMHTLGCRGTVSCMSEPPLLARMGLMNRVPVLEIDGMHWSLKPEEEISELACEQLLARILSSPRQNGNQNWILRR